MEKGSTARFYQLGSAAITLALFAGCHKARPAPPAEPVPIAPEHAAYVTDNGSDALSVIDREGANVAVRSIDVDPNAHEAPHHLTVDRRSGVVFVALSFPPPVVPQGDPHASHGAASDPGKLIKLDLGTLRVTESRPVDENPGDVVLTHDRTRVLVTHFDMRRALDAASRGEPPSKQFATLQVWDARTMQKIGSRPLCVAPHGISTTIDDKKALVACYGSDELAVVDLTSEGLPSSRFPVGPQQGPPGAPRYGPYSATVAPDGRRVVVADLEAGDVRLFDLEAATFQNDRAIVLGAKAMMPDFFGENVVIVPTQSPDGLARVDIASGKIERRVDFDKATCESPHVVRRAHDGRAYVVCEGDHAQPGAVLEIDPGSLAVKRRWTVGVYPDGIAFGED